MGLEDLGFSQVDSQIDTLFPHSIGHWLGIDLHDTPTVSCNTILKKGMIITIEPGLYIPDSTSSLGLIPERYRGIGIRIEDDILIGENGCTVLTQSAPKEISEIEECMHSI